MLTDFVLFLICFCKTMFLRYTQKTSSYWTSSYKMSSYKTSIYQTFSYKTSRLQNILITKRPYYQTSRLPNVQLPNVQLQNYDVFSPLKKICTVFNSLSPHGTRIPKIKFCPRHLPEIDTESYYKSTEIPSSTYFFHTTGAMYTQLKIKMVTLTLKRQHCAI